MTDLPANRPVRFDAPPEVRTILQTLLDTATSMEGTLRSMSAHIDALRRSQERRRRRWWWLLR